nr:PREDICTED: uncharacterized protein LOC106495222 [Apteryx mantelli mantelli]
MVATRPPNTRFPWTPGSLPGRLGPSWTPGSPDVIFGDRHWLAGAYPEFAVPYFVYDVYAMFLCHWHRGRVKGHEVGPPPSLRAAAAAYLRKDLLMVLHHAAMVLVCFPVAAVSRGRGRRNLLGDVALGGPPPWRGRSRGGHRGACLRPRGHHEWGRGLGTPWGHQHGLETEEPLGDTGWVATTSELYSARDLQGLAVEHAVEAFREGETVVLTLKDKGAPLGVTRVVVISSPDTWVPREDYKRQHTALHKLNGLAMLVTFFGCRVLLFPYLYWAYGRHAGLPLLRVVAIF